MESLSNSVFLEFETMNTDRHKDAKPPQQAYLYFPSEMEIVQFDNGNSKKLLRRIFEGGVLFNSFETEHLNQFNLFLKKKNFTLGFLDEEEKNNEAAAKKNPNINKMNFADSLVEIGIDGVIFKKDDFAVDTKGVKKTSTGQFVSMIDPKELEVQ